MFVALRGDLVFHRPVFEAHMPPPVGHDLGRVTPVHRGDAPHGVEEKNRRVHSFAPLSAVVASPVDSFMEEIVGTVVSGARQQFVSAQPKGLSLVVGKFAQGVEEATDSLFALLCVLNFIVHCFSLHERGAQCAARRQCAW